MARSDTAAIPVVCGSFKEFCDCAACLVLKRQGACAQCPSSEPQSARRSMAIRLRPGAFLPGLALLLGLSCTSPSDPAAPRVSGLYAVWFAGSGDADRAEIARFLPSTVREPKYRSAYMLAGLQALRG